MTRTGLVIALVIALLVPLAATAGPLATTVTRAPLDPAVVVVPASAGATTLERYLARSAKPVSDTPLVVIARLPDANSPDVIAVTDAHRDGTRIAIAIETRRYDGPLHGNVVTIPLVEVALGTLPKGTYTIDIDEKVLQFSKLDAPTTATRPHHGLQSSITLTVQ
jgi:hypothetical protein